MIILEDLNTEFGNIKIMRSKSDGTYSYFQESCFHSQINEDGVSTCGYVHVMYSIIRQSKARRVLMIGGAGGTLATMLHHFGCKVTVVDINPHAFTLARKYFQMPEEIECVVGDGWSYLHKTNQYYAAIAIDAFSGDGTVPEQFTNEDFYGVVREALDPRGVVVMNVMVAHDIDMLADRIALNMEVAKMPAVLFDRPGLRDRNVIIAGGAVQRIRIASHRKPVWVRHELCGIIRRNAKKQTNGSSK
jgi:spermidine synthase